MAFQDILEEIAKIPYLLTVMYLIIIAVAAIIVERILTRQIKRFTRGKDLPPEVTNGILLITRLVVLLGAISAAFSAGGIPADWVVSVSAVAGAAVGFASTRTIGNLLAGLYVMISRPFRVTDYVQLGGIEGIVKEITINYTKILTPDGQIVSFSNQKVLDQVITNFRVENGKRGLYCYPIEVTFDHSLSSVKVQEVFNAVSEKYSKTLPKPIEYQLVKLTRLERTYRIYVYVKRPEDIFKFCPRILSEITETWERVKSESS